MAPKRPRFRRKQRATRRSLSYITAGAVPFGTLVKPYRSRRPQTPRSTFMLVCTHHAHTLALLISHNHSGSYHFMQISWWPCGTELLRKPSIPGPAYVCVCVSVHKNAMCTLCLLRCGSGGESIVAERPLARRDAATMDESMLCAFLSTPAHDGVCVFLFVCDVLPSSSVLPSRQC